MLRRTSRAFTLIEMVVAAAIAVTVMAMTIMAIAQMSDVAVSTQRSADAQLQARTALDSVSRSIRGMRGLGYCEDRISPSRAATLNYDPSNYACFTVRDRQPFFLSASGREVSFFAFDDASETGVTGEGSFAKSTALPDKVTVTTGDRVGLTSPAAACTLVVARYSPVPSATYTKYGTGSWESSPSVVTTIGQLASTADFATYMAAAPGTTSLELTSSQVSTSVRSVVPSALQDAVTGLPGKTPPASQVGAVRFSPVFQSVPGPCNTTVRSDRIGADNGDRFRIDMIAALPAAAYDRSR